MDAGRIMMSVQQRIKSIFELEMERRSLLSNNIDGRRGDQSQAKTDSRMILLLRYPPMLSDKI
jgi:hypothetical protein